MSLSNIIKRFNLDSVMGGDWKTNRLYSEQEFRRILSRERARVERSGKRFALVIFDIGSAQKNVKAEKHLLQQLHDRMRATDDAGWVRDRSVGAILHDATSENAWNFATSIQKTFETEATLPCKVYAYPPEPKNGPWDYDEDFDKSPADKKAANKGGMQPILEMPQFICQGISFEKRCVDIVGSLLGLIVLSPLFLVISLIIRLVSPGSALYSQVRIGVAGRPFKFWKFRTMALNADTTKHRQYLAQLIKNGGCGQGKTKPMIKLDDHNPQIIPFGKFLRKTCLDELPQLINVLRGDMSLIGPRPPIPYEVKEYKLWHTCRFDVVPGMTGLWQVCGKNRLTFDEMVRLDIKYARQQSFWMDLKILLMTPFAIALELNGAASKIRL